MAAPHRGFLLIDKPRGVSSHGIVETVRRTLAPGRRRRGAGRFRCGHAGTLDPLATGLLLVLCGPETRLSRFLLGHDKRYDVTLRLGEATDTLDADGETTATGGSEFGAADVAAALDAFRGDIEQVPPVISALKRGGRPMYEIVRRGQVVPELEGRPVRVHEIGVCGEARRREGICDVDLSVHCSSGTYVRSLARDIASALGTVGHVRALRRTAVGPFEVADALAAARLHDIEALDSALRPSVEAFPEWPSLSLAAEEAEDLRRGVQPGPAWLERVPETARFVRMVDASGDLVAVGERASAGEGAPEVLRTAAVFPPSDGERGREPVSCD